MHVRSHALATALIAAVLVAAPLRAAEPEAPEGALDIKPGEKLVLSLEADDKGRMTPHVVTDDQGDQPVVTLSFTKSGSDRILTVKNGYPKTLRFEAVMCVGPRNKCSRTSIMRVLPNLTNLESWDDPITVLKVYHFELNNDQSTR